MNELPDWILSAIRTRMEKLDHQLRTNPLYTNHKQEELASFEKLKESMSEDQVQLLLEWEEQINFLISEEKEQLYTYGVIDGFHLYGIFCENGRD